MLSSGWLASWASCQNNYSLCLRRVVALLEVSVLSIISALKILHVGEDISSRGFFFFFQAFLVEDFLHFFFFFGRLGWRIILLGVL